MSFLPPPLKKWDGLVRWDQLSDAEAQLARLHKNAVLDGHFTYDDPVLCSRVMTRLRFDPPPLPLVHGPSLYSIILDLNPI